VEAVTEGAARVVETAVATAATATVEEVPVVGVVAAEMAVEGMAVVTVAARSTHRRSSAPHAAQNLLRTDRFCGCCHEPRYAD
jgi:hypothetical protein